MANNDIEIEIKVSVTDSEFKEIREKLGMIAKFEKTVTQEDEYFDLPHRSFLSCEYPFEWVSIRKRGDKTIFNFKRLYPPNVPEFIYADEFETEVRDGEKLKKILSLMDLKSLVIVKKTRDTYNYQNEFEVALDIIEELGYFIEIEAMKDFGGVEETRRKLFEFANEIGVNLKNKVNRGYPYLLMKKRGLIR